jgi:hypothetical protein
MPITISSLPVQVKPPTPLGQRVSVDSTLGVTGGPLDVLIKYEVQEHHAALGFQITEGTERTETLANGTHVMRHRFLLVGPSGVLNVVDCRIQASASGTTRTRGFAVQIDNP